MNQSISEEFRDTFKPTIGTPKGYEGSTMLYAPYEEVIHWVEYKFQSKISEAVTEAKMQRGLELFPVVQEEISKAIAEDRKELREKVEGMKTYTGGSSVNEKDKRVNKQEVLSLLEEK